MSFLYAHGWGLFIVSEGLTWVAGLMFFVTRYGFRFNRLSQCFLYCIILFTIFQGLLAGINYLNTGQVSLLQVVIILFIIYAATLGSSDFERLDLYIKQKVNKYRHPNQSDRKYVDTSAYLKQRQLLFILHTTVFIGVHLLLFAFHFNDFIFFYLREWVQHPHQGLFQHSLINIISYVWSIIYIFDLYFYLTNAFIWWCSKLNS
ncbi:hypothetical protein D7Z54_18430 [Salibacterium salarium]|uniref:Uncharacterized protein n=1 Tax=Salibacterium salarium TaxID=284579 RepID=A0A3R9QJ94_9BACI|nr:hypothetical protein [Salibacterium salarium]RSL31956.1 hypothetical protein D7Z54_18430 [Salibacterium salarium]